MDTQHSTPISKLPNIGGGNIGNNEQMHQTTTYTPLNPHKNPYIDAPPPNGFMTPPMHVGNGGRNANERNMPNIDEISKYALPSRDIPRNTNMLVQDEQAMPSYIPRHEKMDYIENETKMASVMENKKRNKHVHFSDDSLMALQQPLILSLVFFIFHLPAISNLFCKYLGSFGFAGIDGNINVAGIMLKSILFGIVAYLLGENFN